MDRAYPYTQFEIRFTQVLNFIPAIRDLLSPYLRMASTFQYNNQVRNDEFYKLNFGEDLFSIDCRWDRIVFLCEDDPTRFVNSNSLISTFWEILEKITQLSTFGKLTNCVFINNEINIVNASDNEILNRFKNKYLTNANSDMMNKIDDVSIILEKRKPYSTTITYGPYSENDIEKFNLFPFNSKTKQDIAGKFGTLFNLKIFSDYPKFDKDVFSKFLKEYKDLAKNFQI